MTHLYELNSVIQNPPLIFSDLPDGLVKPVVNFCLNNLMPQWLVTTNYSTSITACSFCSPVFMYYCILLVLKLATNSGPLSLVSVMHFVGVAFRGEMSNVSSLTAQILLWMTVSALLGT